MPNEQQPDDLLRVWQDQPVENMQMPLEELRRKAGQFEATIRNRNRREYLAGVVVVAGFTFYIFKFSDILVRAGSALIVAGTFYVMYQLYRRSSPATMPADLGLTASLAYHREELMRQRALLQSVWSWYLAPLVPGLLVFGKGVSSKHDSRFVVYMGMFAIVFGLVWWLNRRAAGRLTRQIEELDNLET